jgi:pimeloyl-ACP methyl ester carboxylesterase
MKFSGSKVAALFLIAALFGCGSSPSSDTSSPKAPAPAGTPAENPTGKATKPGLAGALYSAGSCPRNVPTSGSSAPAGWLICPGTAARPAILLFHGNGNDGQAWTKPSVTAPNIEGIFYEYADFRHTPDDKRLGEEDKPNVGFYKIGRSEPLNPDPGNWWDFLVRQDFTVATWDQAGSSFDDAYASAKKAFAELVNDTANLNPVPHIALIGHSRGGLLIRKLLKESPAVPGVDRVRWVVTLHSPHHGSDMARAWSEIAAEVVDLVDTRIPGSIPGPFGNVPITGPIRAELKKIVAEQFRFLNKMSKYGMADNDRELMTDGPLVQDIARGEAALRGVKYYTFGGDTPTYFKLYVWVFDLNSSVPQFKGTKMYYVWRVRAVELPVISPMLDGVRDFTPEITPGKGDGFVTDKSAQLPFSIHEKTHLNHMEVLWDKRLQLKVLGLLTAR